MIAQRSFPHRQSALSYKCKAGVLGSQLHRFNSRTTSMSAFLDRAEKFFRKMAGHHFTPRSLFKQVEHFRSFSPTKGSYMVVLRKLRKRLRDILPTHKPFVRQSAFGTPTGPGSSHSAPDTPSTVAVAPSTAPGSPVSHSGAPETPITVLGSPVSRPGTPATPLLDQLL